MRTTEGAECVWDVGCELGEGALWRAAEEAVWFVDIKKQQVHRLAVTSGERRSWNAPQQVSFILPGTGGRWVAGLQSGPHRFDPATGHFEPLPAPERHPPSNRLNDGYVDPQGRLWFGSMADDESTREGCLYRLQPDGRSKVQDDGYVITNGPCLSPDGRTLYHTDTRDKVIYAFDIALDGALSDKRPFVRIARAGASPDGCFVDAEGCVWTALFGGWGLERYSPAGELLDYVRLPVSNVTKAAFGGPDLRTLFITTAKLHLSPDQRQAQPLAGGLFRINVDVPGLPQQEVSEGL